MTNERKYDPEKNEQNCEEFKNHLDNGRGEEAYILLKENPDLIDELRICDVSSCYQDILRYAGDKQAHYFWLRTAKRIFIVLGNEIYLINQLEKARKDSQLEEHLKELSEKSKKLLDRMED